MGERIKKMFMNWTETIGIILKAGTQTVTGDIISTLFLVLIFLFAICIMFSIALEWIAIIILPLCLAMASEYNNFIGPVTVIIIYISMIITKNWIFK